MKAVYEMPRVSMEMFNVNEVVAACGKDVYKTFNCGTGKEYDSFNVLTEAMSCGNKAIFLETTDDTIEFNTSNHSANIDNSVSWSGEKNSYVATATGQENSVFKGWVYITGYDNVHASGDNETWYYDTDGWTVTSTTTDGKTVKSLSWASGNSSTLDGTTSYYDRYHAMFAAVFGVFSAFSHS